MTPFEITTGTLAVANGTFSVATNFWKLRSVDEDLKVCLRLLGIITQDLNEARKLRSRKFSHDCSSEGLLARVDNAIEDLDIAAKDVGTALEASRVEKATKNKISIAKRFGWVFNGKDKFQAQQWAVNAAHNRLLQIITTMEALPDTVSLTVSPPPYEDVILRSPSQKRAGTGKTTSIIIETNAVFPYEDAARGGLDPSTTFIGNPIPVIEEVAQLQVISGSPSRLRAREGRRTSDVGITDATPTDLAASHIPNIELQRSTSQPNLQSNTEAASPETLTCEEVAQSQPKFLYAPNTPSLGALTCDDIINLKTLARWKGKDGLLKASLK